MFRRFLNVTILNSVINCKASSEEKQIDDLKLKTGMVQAPHIQRGSAVE
jgi:hypothetical protein